MAEGNVEEKKDKTIIDEKNPKNDQIIEKTVQDTTKKPVQKKVRLTKEERQRLEQKLAEMWPSKTKEEILKEFSGKTWKQLQEWASRLKLKRLRNSSKKAEEESAQETVVPVIQVDEELKKQAQKALETLKTAPSSVNELSKKLDISKETVIKILELLRFNHYLAEKKLTILVGEKIRGDVKLVPQETTGGPTAIEPIYKDCFKFMVIGSTHLGNKHQQLSLLYTAYKFAEEAGVNFVIHTGDFVDGKPLKQRVDECFLHTADRQRDYAVEVYPRSDKFKTYIIAGKADISFGGRNLIREICARRPDLIYKGDYSATFHLKKINVQAIYPRKGIERPYTVSYRPQQIAKSIVASIMPKVRKEGGLSDLPHMVFTGKFMVSGQLPRGFSTFMVPGFLAQTPAQQAANISPDVGFLIVEVRFDEKGNYVHSGTTTDFYNLAPYTIANDFGEFPDFGPLGEKDNMVLELLKNEPMSLGELSRHLNWSADTIKAAYENIKKLGYDIEMPTDTKKVTLTPVIKKKFEAIPIEIVKNLSCGFVSDLHFGSKKQQPTLVKTIYDFAEQEWKVDFMVDGGDIIDGKDIYRGQETEVFAIGADDQVDEVISKFPRKNFLTFKIGGNHDATFWNKGGHDINRHIAELRSDIKYLGKPGEYCTEGKAEFNGLVIQLVHPRGGGGQFRSYKPQKHIENAIEYALSKILELDDVSKIPHVYAMGHWHVAGLFQYMGVFAFLVPTLQAQTSYMKELGLAPDIGAWFVRFGLDKYGNVIKLTARYLDLIPFVKDKDY